MLPIICQAHTGRICSFDDCSRLRKSCEMVATRPSKRPKLWCVVFLSVPVEFIYGFDKLKFVSYKHYSMISLYCRLLVSESTCIIKQLETQKLHTRMLTIVQPMNKSSRVSPARSSQRTVRSPKTLAKTFRIFDARTKKTPKLSQPQNLQGSLFPWGKF